MTVAEAVSVLEGAKSIRISWNAVCTEIDPNDEMMMDAYGRYVVKSIRNYFEAHEFELKIAMRPVKAEEIN